jgi:hypothetical protein
VTDLDRGILARIDRKLLAGLDQDETYRMVRIPVTAAKWSTWKRYCDSAGISMGRAIVTLIDWELVSVFGDQTGNRPSVFAEQAEEELASRQTEAARREQAVAATEGRLRRWSEHLRSREDELKARELQVETLSKLSARPADTLVKVGRNDRCPCGSGLEYKHCHGLPVGRSQPSRGSDIGTSSSEGFAESMICRPGPIRRLRISLARSSCA